jgi:LPS-assembly protein
MRAVLAALVLLIAAYGPAFGQIGTYDESKPVILRADELIYDLERGLVIAAGNVEIAQGERILLADTVTYSERTDTVTASGNVTLLEPSGEVIFADSVELEDELRQGVIRNIRILLADDSRFAANGAVRTGGNRTEMRKAVYSPCKLCPEHPDRPPLWQIKAVRIIHDEARQEIEYNDVIFEFFGVPVAYTPYFSHPDPSVERRSGFLPPSYGNSSNLGFVVQVPYFFNLAPHRDVTFEPIFTSREGMVLAGEYRERTQSGKFELYGSITRPKRRGAEGELIGGHDTRGHVEGDGRFDLDDTWQWGFKLDRSTDDTYLRRYGFSSEDTLTSRLFVEGFGGRSYASLNGFAFQGLQIDDDPGETPLVLPLGEAEYISDPIFLGGRARLGANVAALYRTDGADTRRLSISGAWEVPYIGPIGDVYNLSARLRGDLYWLNDPDPLGTGSTQSSNVVTRGVPELVLGWRYPWVAQGGGLRETIEPVAMFAVSPKGNNDEDIPNEDSTSFEFNDINLLDANRFPGLDRVEGGPRASFGVRLGLYAPGGGRASAFFGQSWREDDEPIFADGSGLEHDFSDFVGRVGVSFADLIDVTYRFRLDRETFTPRRNEVDFSGGLSWLRLNLQYLSLDEAPVDPSLPIGKREEVNSSAELKLGEFWSVVGENRRDLTNESTINMGAGIIYQDECLFFSLKAEKRFTEDRDFGPETTVKFTIKLRQLG